MRPIEFKVWDYQHNCWISSSKLRKETYIDLEFSLINDYFIKDGREINRWELVQYTGLKDKNGKKIFEGDIIKSRGFYPSIVKYDNDFAQFVAEDVNFLDANEEWEIIGNKFENPELLNTN